MKSIFAVTLVVITLATAQVPRRKIEIIRQSSPYSPNGWHPSGPPFNITPISTDTENTTTEESRTEEITTEEIEREYIKNVKLKSEMLSSKLEEASLQSTSKGSEFYVVLHPQGQNLLYTSNNPLVALPRANFVATNAPRSSLQVVPFSSSFSANSIWTPFSQSASFVQIY